MIRTAALSVAVVLAAAVLAGCAGQEQSGTPAHEVSVWVSGAGGGAAVRTLEADSSNVALALSRHDPPSVLKTVCALLTTDAETDIGNLPTPDTRLTDDLNAAYEDAAAAGDHCYQGAGGTASPLRESAAERAKLVPLIGTALARIVAVTGRTPSTSTTQPPPGGDPFGGS